MPRRNRSTNKYPENRSHTTRDANRSIQKGITKKQVKKIAAILGIPYKEMQQKGN